MDFVSFFLFSVLDFLKFLIPLVILVFVLYKLLNPIKEKLMDDYEIDWIKSVFSINFLAVFVFLFLIYLYFYLTSMIIERPLDPELTHTIFEIIMFILVDTMRIAVASFIIALSFLIFEFLFGVIFDLLKNTNYSDTIKELVAITISCAVFLFLILFIFNWAIIGLFIYIFFGGISQMPLV